MKFGTQLIGVRPKAIKEVAQAAEQNGFESLWRPDHMFFPSQIPATYPYSKDGMPPVQPHTPILDPFGMFTFAAAVTSEIRFCTNVYILPLRHPFVTARAVQTLDLLSGGRAMLGVGAGWLEDEFRVAGIDFRSRGTRMNECIQVLRALWTEPEVAFHGRHFSFEGVRFEPKPIQKPPPIFVGGETEPALRRAAKLGDGWIGVHHSPEEIREMIGRLTELRREAGRGEAPFEITISASAELTAEDVHRYEEAGVHRLVVGFNTRSSDIGQAMAWFREHVIARS